MPETFTIVPRGPFSLAEAIGFGFGQRDAAGDDVMRLAFCLDGYQHQAGVEVRQDEAGVHGTVHGPGGADVDAVRQQVARVLSLDYDAAGFLQAGERDPVLRSLQDAAPGLRPPLFYSPYEAAAWAVLSVRRPPKQMMAVRERFSRAHGAVFDLAGQQLAALPTPEQMLAVESFPGIAPDRMERLHGVARAAQEGRLDAGHLLALGPGEATTRLQEIPGIGPFYSALIVIRGTGFADVLPAGEPKLLTLVERLYELRGPASDEELRALAETWKPFRTWAAVLIRAAAAAYSAANRRNLVPIRSAGGAEWGTRSPPARQPPSVPKRCAARNARCWLPTRRARHPVTRWRAALGCPPPHVSEPTAGGRPGAGRFRAGSEVTSKGRDGCQRPFSFLAGLEPSIRVSHERPSCEGADSHDHDPRAADLRGLRADAARIAVVRP